MYINQLITAGTLVGTLGTLMFFDSLVVDNQLFQSSAKFQLVYICVVHSF